jgi:hypothetical protein
MFAERIESLRHKHAELEKVIHTVENRPLPDETELHNLKRQKLALKDEIERLSHTHGDMCGCGHQHCD